MDKLIAALLVGLMVFGLAVFICFLGAVITQWAWAGSVAQIFHLPELSFWQAFWLNMLGAMVCKSSSAYRSKS